jgi:hypothetical protein
MQRTGASGKLVKSKKTIIAAMLLGLALGVAAYGQESEPITTRSAAPDPEQYQFVEVVGGLTRPLYVTHAGDGSGRLFVVEQDGRIWVLNEGILQAPPFLDVSRLVSRGGNEQDCWGWLSTRTTPTTAFSSSTTRIGTEIWSSLSGHNG